MEPNTDKAWSPYRLPLQWQVCILVAAAVLPFTPVLGGVPVLDDRQYLLHHPVTTGSAPWTEAFTRTLFGAEPGNSQGPCYWRPLLILWFRAWLAIAGPAPALFHGLNLLLHAANAVLLLFVARRCVGPGLPAALGAGLFALHPAVSESVAWISGNTDLLALAATLACALLWERHGLLAAGLWLVALLCKETAFPVPLALALLFPRTTHWRSRRWVWLGLAALSYASLRWLAPLPEFETGTPLLQRLADIPAAVGAHLRGLAIPQPLAFQRHVTAADCWLVSLSACAAAAWLFLADARVRPQLGWILLFLLPVSGVLPVATMEPGALPISCRYLYFPAAGLGLLMARVTTPRNAWWLLAMPLLLALTVQYAARFRSSAGLLTHALQVSPRSAALWCTLGEDLLVDSMEDPHPVRSAARARAALAPLQQAIALRPAWRRPLRSRAMALACAGELAQAEATARDLALSEPADAVAASYLANILMLRGRLEEAGAWLEVTLQRDPRYEPARSNLAWLERRRQSCWLSRGMMAAR